MIVLDASAALEVLLRTPRGLVVEARALAPEESLHAPELIDLEVLQVLRRYVRRSDLSDDRAAEAIDDFEAFPIYRYPHGPLRARIWELRDNLSAYDAAYVALAQALAAPLLTCDAALASAPMAGAVIELV